MSDYITTYTGKHFFPLDPKPDDIYIDDIAHALSLTCRGNGQVSCFYSVGEHCVNCAREAKARGYSERVILACLLHDASESYMSDVPRPFKKFLKDYQELEEKLLSIIYVKYIGRDLDKKEKLQVKEIDNDVLAYDLYYLLKEGREVDLPKLEQNYEYGKLLPKTVEMEYRKLFQQYRKKIDSLQ